MKKKWTEVVGQRLTMPSHRIGVLYLITCMLFLIVGMAAALLIQLDMLNPLSQLAGPKWFEALLTGHGMLMIFLVLLPIFPGVFGHTVFLSAIGANELPWPIVRFLGWMCHAVGGGLIIVALSMGAYDGGWTMMLPVAGGHHTWFTVLIIGLLLAALSVSLPSAAIVRAFLSRRFHATPAPQLSLLAWFFFLGALAQVLITPIRLITLAFLFGGHNWEWTYLMTSNSDGIARYLLAFWMYTGPATLSLLVPSIGILFEIVSSSRGEATHERTLLVGAGLIFVALSLASFGQHLVSAIGYETMFLTGALLGLLALLPLTVLVIRWLRLWQLMRNPFPAVDFFALVAIVCGLFAVLTAVAMSIPALTQYLHSTYFSVAHLHFSAFGFIGGVVLAGLSQFWTNSSPPVYVRTGLKASSIGFLVGMLFSFVPMLIMGSLGLPKSIVSYPSQYQILHTLSTAGSIVLAVSVLLGMLLLIMNAIRPDVAASDTEALSGGLKYRFLLWRNIKERGI